jgi:Helix-turn-helix domain
MPTISRRPTAQRERDRLEARRLRAAELFAAGVRQAEVARQLEVSDQAVSVWHARWQTGGTEALRSRGPSGPAPRLSDGHLARVQRFLDAHHGQSAELLGSGWATLDPPQHAIRGPRNPPDAQHQSLGLPAAVAARLPSGSLGSLGRSALAAARRHRSEELTGWTRTLVWRAPLVAAAGLAAQVLAAHAGLPWAGLAGLAAAALVAWRLRYRRSAQVQAWQRGAQGERRTARLLDRLRVTVTWSSTTWPSQDRPETSTTW